MENIIPETKLYVIDWDKISTFEDLKRVVKASTSNWIFREDGKNISTIRDLVKDKPDGMTSGFMM